MISRLKYLVRRPFIYLRTENLNNDLYDFLCDMGYSDEEIAFVKEVPPVQPEKGTEREDRDWKRYFKDDGTLEKFYQQEKYLLMMLKRLGIGEPSSWPCTVL